MDFCKIVKEFDCTKFSEHSLYYVHWHDVAGKPIKAIYLCDIVDKESNSIDLKRVVPIQGNCPAHAIRLGSGDVNCIDEVQEVEMDVEYNTNWRWWKIECEIQPEIKEVSHQYNFIEDRLMTDKTKKAFNNAIASVRMEGFDFTDEQIESLAELIEQVDDGKITWREAIDSIIQKYRRND